jgi:predicted phage replisome organizer
MASNKRYYWLKLKADFFKRHDIRVIESMQNGKDYVLFLLKLMTESIHHEGNLRFSDTLPYNEEMLSAITNTNVDIVRSAMKIFVNLGMVDILDDETIYMTEVEKLIGSETQSTIRSRKSRAKQLENAVYTDNLLQCNTNATQVQQNCNTRDKSKRIEKENNQPTTKTNKQLSNQDFNIEAVGDGENIPSLLEVEQYVKDNKLVVSGKYFFDFNEAREWKTKNGDTIKNWKLLLLKWNRYELEHKASYLRDGLTEEEREKIKSTIVNAIDLSDAELDSLICGEEHKL